MCLAVCFFFVLLTHFMLSVVNVHNTKHFQSQRPSAIPYSLRYDGRNTYARRRSGTLCVCECGCPCAARTIMCSSNPLRVRLSPVLRSVLKCQSSDRSIFSALAKPHTGRHRMCVIVRMDARFVVVRFVAVVQFGWSRSKSAIRSARPF